MLTCLFTGPISPLCGWKKTARPRFLIQISSPVPWPVSSLSSHWSLKWLWGALSQFYMQIGLHLGSGAGLLRAYLCKSDWVRAYCWGACAGRRLYFTGPAASVFRRRRRGKRRKYPGGGERGHEPFPERKAVGLTDAACSRRLPLRPSRFYSIGGQMECKWHRTSVISYAHFVNGLTSQYVQHTTITECGINPLIKW